MAGGHHSAALPPPFVWFIFQSEAAGSGGRAAPPPPLPFLRPSQRHRFTPPGSWLLQSLAVSLIRLTSENIYESEEQPEENLLFSLSLSLLQMQKVITGVQTCTDIRLPSPAVIKGKKNQFIGDFFSGFCVFGRHLLKQVNFKSDKEEGAV